MVFEKLNPVFWLSAGNLKAYTRFLNVWFAYVKNILDWPRRQFDADSADLFVVDLLAWESGIDRFDGEPEWLYRLRVKHASKNAKDAGSAAGFKAIWERMGLGYVDIEERIPARDWDIINLTVTDHALSQYPGLIDVILANYAITCRRYELTTIAIDDLKIRINHFGEESQNLTARI